MVKQVTETRPSATRQLATCALCIALLVVSCFFTVPIGPVPFTLQTLVIILIALLLPPKLAFATTGIYLLMGAIGLPVFSSMTGGIGKILGPTGGFLISYPIATTIMSFVRMQLEKRDVKQVACDVVAAAGIIVICDILGWLWLMVSTQTDPLSAFMMADAPFIFIDCCKAAVAIAVAKGVRAAIGTR